MTLLQRALNAYGYRIEDSGEHDPQTRFVFRAFQSHFRPSNWSGQPDAETAAILFAHAWYYQVGQFLPSKQVGFKLRA